MWYLHPYLAKLYSISNLAWMYIFRWIVLTSNVYFVYSRVIVANFVTFRHHHHQYGHRTTPHIMSSATFRRTVSAPIVVYCFCMFCDTPKSQRKLTTIISRDREHFQNLFGKLWVGFKLEIPTLMYDFPLPGVTNIWVSAQQRASEWRARRVVYAYVP